jgi:hypothetical protein
MDIQNPMKLTFEIQEENNRLNKEFVIEDQTTWTEVVLRFADFLSAHYGYNIKEKIVFVSNFTLYDDWSEIGERTISSAAYQAARDFDEMMDEAKDAE